MHEVDPVKEDKNYLLQKVKHLLSWVKRAVELNESYFNIDKDNSCKPYALLGEIYYAELGTNIGVEIDRKRPVLVFQNNSRFLRQSNLVFIIPITNNVKPSKYKVIFTVSDVSESAELLSGALLVSQAKSISKMRLIGCGGKLSENKIKEVAANLRDFLFKNISFPSIGEGDAQTIYQDPAR